MAPSPQEEQLRRERAKRRAERARHAATYQFAAVAATAGVSFLAVFATYYRIAQHLHNGEEFPWTEMGATILLAFGGAVGMEM